MTEYTVTYERGERSWSADVPDLPGCIATGATRESAEQEIREAIAFYVEALPLHGQPVAAQSIALRIIQG